MRVERIRAASMREAMTKIKQKLGEDAVILHTRTVADGIEVIAAQDSEQSKTGNNWLDDVLKKDKELRAEKKTNMMNNTADSSAPNASYNRAGKKVLNNTENPSVKEPLNWDSLMDEFKVKSDDMNVSNESIEKLNNVSKTPDFSQTFKNELLNQEQRKIWIEHEKQLDNLKQEMVDLKESLLRQELIELKQRADYLKKQKQERELVNRATKSAALYDEFVAKIKMKILDRGFSKTTTKLVTDRLLNEMESVRIDLNTTSDIQKLKTILTNEIKNIIPIYQPAINGNQRIISVIGPAASGRTTTAAKLALQSLLMDNKKTALVLVSDSEQSTLQHLNKLTAVAKLPLAIISDKSELLKTIQMHSDKDLIIVDFAFSTETKESIDILNDYIKIIKSSEIHFVLPAINGKSEIDQMKVKYQSTSINAVICTFADKLEKTGALVENILNFGKPLSYICNGEMIPDDIEIANAARLTHLILRG